ncbi:MAG TPA: histidine kinase [Nocardioidaceae bacterium]|nr:histidine kinase [Nocardioidaceae bacterium]
MTAPDTWCEEQAQPLRRWWPHPTVVAVLGLVAVAVMVAATLWAEYAQTDGRPMGVDLAVAGAALVLLVVLLRWPVTGALALAVLAAVSPAATPPATMALLHTARTRPFPVALGIALVGVLAHGTRALWRPVEGISPGWWLVLMVAAHAALLAWGSLSRARRALVAALTDRAERAEREQGRRVAEARAAERTRIAREMHDVLAHRLSLLATYAGALEYRPDAPAEQLSHAAGVVRATVHQALEELREVIALLRDEPVEDGADRGSTAPPQPMFADVSGLVEESRAAGMRIRLDDQVREPGAVPAATGRTAFRIVQEALTNARKHAAGQPVAVTFAGAPGHALEIEVRNPVRASPATGTQVPGAGTGLVGLTERARLAGGRLDHQQTADGFRVRASLPWPA